MARRKNNSDPFEDIMSNDPKLEKKLRKKRKKQKKTTKQKVIMGISITAIILALLVVGGLLLMNTSFFGNKLNTTIGTEKTLKEKSVSFLICGVDFEENTSRGKLTDVQMYVNLDLENGNINVLQIPRDTYVTREETSTGKINAIYSRGESYGTNGIEGLAEYIYKAYRLPVDHYATVNMTTFKTVVDAIGGVEMYVPFDIVLEGVTLKQGTQTLNGLQAEKFVRKRKGGNTLNGDGYYAGGSDTERVRMQRLFIAALAKKLKNVSATEFVKILGPMLGDEIQTDLTVADVLAYMGAMQKIDMKNMQIEMLPGESCYTDYGQSVYSLHKQELADLLNEKFRPHAKAVPAEKLLVEEAITEYRTDAYDNNGNSLDELLQEGIIPGTEREEEETSSSTASDE